MCSPCARSRVASLGRAHCEAQRDLLLPRLRAQVSGRLAALTDGADLVPAGLGERVGDFAALALVASVDHELAVKVAAHFHLEDPEGGLWELLTDTWDAEMAALHQGLDQSLAALAGSPWALAGRSSAAPLDEPVPDARPDLALGGAAGDDATAAHGAVLDHNLLAERRAHFVGDRAGHDVVGPARRQWDDERDRPIGIVVLCADGEH